MLALVPEPENVRLRGSRSVFGSPTSPFWTKRAGHCRILRCVVVNTAPESRKQFCSLSPTRYGTRPLDLPCRLTRESQELTPPGRVGHPHESVKEPHDGHKRQQFPTFSRPLRASAAAPRRCGPPHRSRQLRASLHWQPERPKSHQLRLRTSGLYWGEGCQNLREEVLIRCEIMTVRQALPPSISS